MTPANWVLDASAALALILDDENGADVERVIQETLQSEQTITAPALFWFEVLNALTMAMRRHRLPIEDAHIAEVNLNLLPIITEPAPDAFIRGRIRELAHTYELTAYDAAYLECAQRHNRFLKTYDRHLLNLRSVFPFIV